MYSWLWHKIPGGIPGKLAGMLVLIVAAVAVLFLVVFPWAGPKLPFNHVTVNTPAHSTTRTPSPATPT